MAEEIISLENGKWADLWQKKKWLILGCAALVLMLIFVIAVLIFVAAMPPFSSLEGVGP